jgi:hypothetical protein
MKTIFKSIIIAVTLVFMLIVDVPLLFEQLVPEAEAFLGTRRRTRRRTAVIVGSAASAKTAAAQKQAATSQQEAATAKQEAADAKQEAEAAKQQAAAVPAAPSPSAAGKPLPLGTVVAALPAGCTPTPVGGVQYYYCSGNFYRAAFQGNSLVYVTAKPE